MWDSKTPFTPEAQLEREPGAQTWMNVALIPCKDMTRGPTQPQKLANEGRISLFHKSKLSVHLIKGCSSQGHLCFIASKLYIINFGFRSLVLVACS